MSHSSDYGVSDLFQDPVLILDIEGRVRHLNRSARRCFGDLHPDQPFAQRVENPNQLQELLRRFSSCAEPSFGTLETKTKDGTSRFKVTGARLSTIPAIAIGLRFSPVPPSEFTILSHQIKALHAEIHQHRIARRRLEEALETNQTLYRELQHRVKNHLQIVMAMFGIARRKTKTERERDLIDLFERRIGAVAEVQHLMYAVSSMVGVPAVDLVNAIAKNFRELTGSKATIKIEAISDEFLNEYASPIALILNELLSNAVKYGIGVDSAAIELSVRREQEIFEVVVQDHGPGFAKNPADIRGSGLDLVRGLCRQIGAILTLETRGGARATIRFKQSSGKRVN